MNSPRTSRVSNSVCVRTDAGGGSAEPPRSAIDGVKNSQNLLSSSLVHSPIDSAVESAVAAFTLSADSGSGVVYGGKHLYLARYWKASGTVLGPAWSYKSQHQRNHEGYLRRYHDIYLVLAFVIVQELYLIW